MRRHFLNWTFATLHLVTSTEAAAGFFFAAATVGFFFDDTTAGFFMTLKKSWDLAALGCSARRAPSSSLAANSGTAALAPFSHHDRKLCSPKLTPRIAKANTWSRGTCLSVGE